MGSMQLFLSHIHEEKDLAVVIKNAIESEFSGFVDVFVSSDGTTIPAGSNFLKKIEDGLIGCVGAIYLISPMSVKRNWINFELGAVWVRNAISVRSSSPEIPTIPICHSGILPNSLPAPLNNLNSIIGNQASQLELSFKSIQTAVGGRGTLRTDFDILASAVLEFEQNYTLGSNLNKFMTLLSGANQQIKQQVIGGCRAQPINANVAFNFDFVETSVIAQLKSIASNELKNVIHVISKDPATVFTQQGAVNGASVRVVLPASLIVKFENELK
jgi:hypothetical protein